VRIEAAILGNRRVAVSEVEHDSSLSHGPIVRIIQELGFHKVCARWVPRALSEDHKAQRMACVLSFLQQYAILSHEFLERIVTGDETWVHHHTPETKVQAWSGNIPGPRQQRKIQDGQIGWQIDGYGVLGPQRCTVGGVYGKTHNNQCSVILCNTRTFKNSH
jgi:hypothetical protein